MAWYEKSKYNNAPIVVYKGRCSNCGHQPTEFEKGAIVNCCLEQVICHYAVDLNEGKTDCQYKPNMVQNDGLVATLINTGISEEEAFKQYYNRYTKSVNLINAIEAFQS